MKNISFQGFENSVLTFEVSEKIEPGTLVTLSENGTVTACGSYDVPAGAVVSCDGRFAAVCVKGVIEAQTDGTLAPGYVPVVCDANGKLTEGEDAPYRLVLELSDTDNRAVILF